MVKRMSPEAHDIFHRMMFMLVQLNEIKYEKGALEHGGLITDMSEEQLEAAELEEMLDLLNYRLAKLLKKSTTRSDPATTDTQQP